MKRPRFLPDNMSLMLLATVAIASFFPVRGTWAHGFDMLSTLMIALLFFMHGAKLSREAVRAGLTHWRLHLLVLAVTFIAFPALGVMLKPMLSPFITPELYLGILFLCVLPSTVQSSIAFTSLAKGNIPAAVCSASASNLLGIFITPLLVGLLIQAQADQHSSADAMLKIVYQLLLPFVAGQIARPYIQTWVQRHANTLKLVDQSSILLVVFVAFSEAVVEGIWHQLPLLMLLSLLLVSAVILALIMSLTVLLSRRLGFSKEDEITIVFCGSKKSLASGVPMAKVLFSSGAVGMVLLPVMLFHQLQLMVCAVLAQHYAKR